jgi:hypothetical protein
MSYLLVLPARTLAQDGWTMPPAERSAVTIQRLVDDLRSRLAIDSSVSVSIVPSNARIVSVSPPRATDRPFELVMEGAFLNALSDDELSAAVAHELGHVWVSTHHPYLQTERLANTIAMRVVSRDSLERVYEKMWARGGRKGDLLAFLGPRSASRSTAARPR